MTEDGEVPSSSLNAWEVKGKSLRWAGYHYQCTATAPNSFAVFHRLSIA
jgi:hypothetical protein